MKLDNVVINKGKFVYSRRIPVDIKHLYPPSKELFFRCRLRVQQQSAQMVAEHEALEAAFARLVEDARKGVPEAFGLGAVDVHRIWMIVAAIEIKALKLWSVLHERMAMPLFSFSLPK